MYFGYFPENIVRNKYIIITSKRRFGVIITYLLCSLFAGLSHLKQRVACELRRRGAYVTSL